MEVGNSSSLSTLDVNNFFIPVLHIMHLSSWHSYMIAEGIQVSHHDRLHPYARLQPVGPAQPKVQLQSTTHAFF